MLRFLKLCRFPEFRYTHRTTIWNVSSLYSRQPLSKLQSFSLAGYGLLLLVLLLAFLHTSIIRVLYRAFDVFPWNKVTGLKDVHKQDMLMGIARHQIEGAFPVLDLLSVCSSLPSACNPVNYFRLVKRLAVSCTCRQRRVMEPVQFPQ